MKVQRPGLKQLFDIDLGERGGGGQRERDREIKRQVETGGVEEGEGQDGGKERENRKRQKRGFRRGGVAGDEKRERMVKDPSDCLRRVPLCFQGTDTRLPLP